MREVEVKFPAALDAVAERLEEAGAEESATVEQRDVYFGAPHRDFAATDEALRVRRVDGDAATTYKGPPSGDDVKSRRELEVGVDDAEPMEAVYEALGFERVATVEKRRRSFALDGVTVCLDEVEGLGSYVELEAVGEAGTDGEDDGLREELRDAADRLDLDWDEGVRVSYLELLLDDG